MSRLGDYILKMEDDDLAKEESRPPIRSKRELELDNAIEALLELIDHANPGAFANGVTDSTGSIDEGEVWAARFCEQARAALAMK